MTQVGKTVGVVGASGVGVSRSEGNLAKRRKTMGSEEAFFGVAWGTQKGQLLWLNSWAEAARLAG